MDSVGATAQPVSLDRALAGWAALAASLLFAALAAPFLLFGRYCTRDDLLAFHLPLRSFYADCLARGATFEWWPNVFCGYAAAAEGQAGMFHPLHWLLYRFLPLDAAFSFELLLSYPFLFAGTVLFLRSQLLPRSAAYFGALAFTFCSFNLLHFVHPNAIAVIAHLPWLLYCLTFILHPSAFILFLTLLLTASQILLGYPQYILYSLLVEVAFVAWRLGSREETGNREQGTEGSNSFPPYYSAFCLLPSAVPFILAKLLGFGLGAIQLLPTLEALRLSSRAASTAEFALSGSLHPLNLLQLVAPYAFASRVVGDNTHEYSLYLGAAPLMLVVWYFTCRRESGSVNKLAIWSLGLAALALALALGAYGPILPWLASLPGGAIFRFPCRYTVLLQFAVAILAAIAFSKLVREKAETPLRRWPLFAVVACSSAATAWIAAQLSSQSGLLLATGPVLFLIAAVLVTFAAGGSRFALTALIVFTALDLGVYGLTYSLLNNTASASQIAARLPVPPVNEPGRVLYDLNDSPAAPRTGNAATLANVSRADGYAGLAPRRVLRSDNINALCAAGVRWVARSPESEKIVGLEPFDSHWLRVPNLCPRAYLVSNVVPSENPARDIASIDLKTAAIVPPSCATAGLRALSVVEGFSSVETPLPPSILIDDPGQIALQTSSSAETFLVLTESFHPDWLATIDGQPCEVTRANGDFLGVAVPAGDHTIQFNFQSRSVRLGARVSLLSACMALAFCAVIYRNKSTSHTSLKP